ncbi:MAG: alpha-L-arabinofuranosidase C-terminal domain-containing protein, partial [Terracidiphilus sp.]|nr:alpha-L-arabinofuranosidase C-terminal domain-containing protein [Terracidiphilus sp.]
MTKKTFAGAATLTALLAAVATAQAPPATLTIHADQPVSKVSPTLYGLMTEEINYSYDGGLYAEMVRNRAFHSDWSGIPYWYLVEVGHAAASMEADKNTGPSDALKSSLRLVVEKADAANPAGILNVGYWGFALRPSTTYKGSFYARVGSEDVGPVTVSVLSDNTGKVLATTTVPVLGSAWKQYTFAFRTGGIAPSSANHLVLTVAHPGTVWFSLVSLFPPTYHDPINGNRIDVMERLAAMHPAFLRFPGGNYLEGDRIADRFDWKKTIGPLVDRPTHPSPWMYHSSDGMGLLEFLEWCEDLKMNPVLAVYAGYSLRGEHVKAGPDLEPFIQDALDEIEYVTGGPDTRWGAERVKDGHPAPFKLTYVEIGNEDWLDHSGSYDERYPPFYKAIKEKYPDLQLIATAPVKNVKMDVLDEHFYVKATQNFHDANHYDKTDRGGPKIFVGEWATREGLPTPDFGAALGDAAWMTGMERNSDIIVMSAYAPLLVNVNPGGMQWETDLIGYDDLHSYGSPAYWAQVMFSKYLGDQTLASKLDAPGLDATSPKLFYSITRDSKKKRLYLKLVNASSTPLPMVIDIPGLKLAETGTLISLTAQST